MVSFNWDREGDSTRVWILIDSTSMSIDPIDSLYVAAVVEVVVGTPAYFQEFDLSEFDIALTDDIALYLGVQQLFPSFDFAFINVDDDASEGNSWWGYPGIGWEMLSGGAFAIRGIVTPQFTTMKSQSVFSSKNVVQTAYDRFSSELILNKTISSDKEELLVSRTNLAQKTKSASNAKSSPVSTLGYNIYRSESSPVNISETFFIGTTGNHSSIYKDSTIVKGDVYYYVVTANYTEGESVPSNKVGDITVSTESLESVPENLVLSSNYPNPFNPTTMLKYQLPQNSDVSLKIYNTIGQLVKTLIDHK